MRQGLLWLSERQGIFNFVRRNGMARKFASRFVAGETIETGVQAAKDLAARGITPSLDLLGESVTVESEATAARDLYIQMLDRMAALMQFLAKDCCNGRPDICAPLTVTVNTCRPPAKRRA